MSHRTKNAMLGSIVHSISFGELEYLERGLLIYNDNGVIERVIDLLKEPQNPEFLSSFKEVHDFSGKLIIPGLVDAHCHAPQYVFTGTGMDLPLLAWLEKYTFPCEARFADTDFARLAYQKSIQRHLKNGTTFASYFATIHNEAGKVLVDVIHAVGQRAFVGKVSMDRNCPDFYREETEAGCDDAEEFVHYVLSQTATGREFLRSVGSIVLGDEMVKRPRVSSPVHLEEEEEAQGALVLAGSGAVGRRSMPHPRTVSLGCSSMDDDTSRGSMEVESTSAGPSLVTPRGGRPRLMRSSGSVAPFLVSPGPSRANSSSSAARPRGFFATSAHSDSLTTFSGPSITNSSGSDPAAVKLVGANHQRTTLLNKPTTPLVMPCVTPRFVPTCTPTIMSHLGELSQRYGLPVQSHLSESVGEIDWVASLHPDCATYAAVYDKYGLLHENVYMAHCCHCSPAERRLLAERGTGVVHCASSNFMLSSGVMDVRTFLEEGIKVALGTDVAGGYSPSMLDALRQCIVASRVKEFDHRAATVCTAAAVVEADAPAAAPAGSAAAAKKYRPLNYSEAFHLATVGGAEVLGMGGVVGNFLPGKKLDCLVVDVNCEDSPIDAFEGETPFDHFQKFLFLGDDRNIQQVFVDGVRVI